MATLLLALLAAEGVTLLNLQALMSVHAFVGVLLIPVVVLKLGSVGWRMLSHYRGRPDYVEAGAPSIALRVLVGPVIIASTILLLGTGVALLALNPSSAPRLSQVARSRSRRYRRSTICRITCRPKSG